MAKLGKQPNNNDLHMRNSNITTGTSTQRDAGVTGTSGIHTGGGTGGSTRSGGAWGEPNIGSYEGDRHIETDSTVEDKDEDWGSQGEDRDDEGKSTDWGSQGEDADGTPSQATTAKKVSNS